MPADARTLEHQPTQPQDADAVLLAVHRTRVDDVLAQAGTLSGKALLGCSLPTNKDDTHMVIGTTWVRKSWRLSPGSACCLRFQYCSQRGSVSGFRGARKGIAARPLDLEHDQRRNSIGSTAIHSALTFRQGPWYLTFVRSGRQQVRAKG